MRILHVADTHLGLRQYGLEARRQDMADAFSQVIDATLKTEIAAVIHAGDLFDNRIPTTDDLRDVVNQLNRLHRANIPFLGIVGNHEGKRGHQWLDLFAQLGLAIHLNAQIPFDLNGVPVYGVDYLSRREKEVAPPKMDGGIVVMHQLLDKSAPHGELALQDLFDCGAKLVLLGDYHEHNVWREGGTLVTYCGSTERASAGEVGRRGFSLIDLDSLALERRELDTRRFVYLGSKKAPLKDPVSELESQAHRLQDAVVVLSVGETSQTPRQLKEEGARKGALYVIVRNVEVDSDDTDTPFAIEQLSSMEHLGQIIDQACQEHGFSDLTLQVDELVRDPDIPDSRVDERITQVLEEAGL
jgi:DNA repair exonuclease SbcCD nuclease subunit